MVTTFWLSPFHPRRLSRYNAICALVALVPQQASDEGLGLVLVGRCGKTSRAISIDLDYTRGCFCAIRLTYARNSKITPKIKFESPPFRQTHRRAFLWFINSRILLDM